MFGKETNDLAPLKEMDKQVRAAFSAVREEMNDHLDSINASTVELQDHSAGLADLEVKFEKLKEQMDNIQIMLSNILAEKKQFKLSESEQSVFMVLYAVEQTPLSYADISMRTGLTELTVKAHVFSMINKGIPIIERQIDGQSFFRLDKKFKELQAKENVLNIENEF